MHPIVLTIPLVDLPVYSYGVMLGLGFISSWYLGMYFTNRESLPYKTVMWAYVLVIVFSLLGARIAHIISNNSWDQIKLYGLFHTLFASKCEGLVAYGGYIGGALAAAAFMRLRRLDFWSLADCSTPSLMLGLGMTRLGCFLAGCCHGRVTDLPWGVVFPAGAQATNNPDCIPPGAVPGTVESLPVHPTQLYESAVGFLLLPLAIYLVRHRKFTGQALLIMIPFYAVARFLLEIIRADSDRGTVFEMFSTSQFIGLVLIPVTIGLYIYRMRKAQAPPEPLSAGEVRASLIEQGVIVPKDDESKKAPEAAPGQAKDGSTAKPDSQKGKGKKKGKRKKGKKRK